MIIPVLLIIIFVSVIGFCFIKLCNLMPTFSLLTRLSYSYGIGVGLIALQMLIYSYLHLSFEPSILLIPGLLFILFVLFKTKTKFTINVQFQFDALSKMLLVGILLTVFFVIFEAVIRPLSAWDAWATWFIGGKALFLAHTIDPQFYTYATFSVQPVVILILTFVFTILGQVNDQSTLLLFTSFYLSLLLMLYSSLRKITSVRNSLFFVFLFATLGNVIRHAGRYDAGYIDLPLAYYFFSCVLLLIQLSEKFSYKTLLLLNFLLAITALVKSEGLPFFIIIQSFILWILYKTKKLKLIIFSVISLLLVGSWPVYLALNHIPQTTLDLLTNHLFIERIPLIAEKIFTELFNIQRWNLLWPTFIICLLLVRFTKTLKFLAIILVAQFFSYCFVYLSDITNTAERLNGSLDRLLLQISPLVIYFIALAALQMKEKNRLKRKFIK